MSLIPCPLQCGKFISSFKSHKSERLNREKLVKFYQQCSYNSEHVLSIKALKLYIYYCNNRPKSSIFKINQKKNETLKIKKEIPSLKIIKNKKIISFPSSYKNIPISFSEGSLKENSKVNLRNKKFINEKFDRIKKQEKQLLMNFINKEEKKIPFNKEKYYLSSFTNINSKFNFDHNSFVTNNHQCESFKKSYNTIFYDKSKILIPIDDTFNNKKNFYW